MDLEKDFIDTYNIKNIWVNNGVLEGKVGCHINDVVWDFIYLSSLISFYYEKKAYTFTFNGVELTVDFLSKTKDVVDYYHSVLDERYRQYLNSEGYKEYQKSRNEEIAVKQAIVNLLISILPDLNMKNDILVLDWLKDLAVQTDDVGVSYNKELVVKTLEDAGFISCENINDDFNCEDRNNFFRYIVGQCLSFMKGPVGVIHPIVNKFVDEWKDKFIKVENNEST